MTSIGTATLQIIPVLRGVSDRIRRETQGLRAEVEVDVPNAEQAGRQAGAGVNRGLRSSRIAAGLQQDIESELSSAHATRTGDRYGSRFGAAMAAAFSVGARGIGRGLEGAVGGAKSVIMHIGAIATATQAATLATTVLARSLVLAGGGLAMLGTGPVGRLAIALGLASRMAGGLARDVGRVTSALIVMSAAARGVQALNSMARIGRNITIGFAGALGVLAGMTQLIAGPLISAVTALGAAFGVAAGAAAGLLGPVAAVAGLASSGIQNAVQAYTQTQKASGGGGGASQAAQARQIESAEKAVARAKRDAEDAEKDLTRARRDATEQIEDMRLALTGAALSEKDAQLALLEAQRDLGNLGKDGQSFDMIDREQAILRVEQAEQRLAEITESNGDLREEAAEQEAKGVEGSDEVVAAKRRVEDANAAVIESQQALTDAINKSNEAAAGGPDVDPFDAMIGQRMAPAIEAVMGLRRTVTDSLTGALTPAFSTFGSVIDGLTPRFAGLSTTIGAIGTSIMNNIASPENRAALDGMFAASDSFFNRFLSGSGVNGVISGLIQFSSTAAETFSSVGGDIDGALGKLGDWLANITPGQMVATMEAVRVVFTNIGNVVGPVVSALRELAGISAPALAPGFQAIGDAIRDATPGVMTMAQVLMPGLGQAMSNIAPLLPGLVNAFTPWATIMGALAPVIASVVAHLGPLAPIILGVAVAAKVIAAAMLAYNSVMAVASVAQGVFVAATGTSTAVLGTNTIALAAHRVALIAGAAASGAMSIATGALNAVMSANPIALVVLAIAALIAGIVLAYKNSETFRNIVQAAWEGIKVAAEAAWNFLKDVVWPGLKAAFSAIGDAAMWLWQNAIQPAWEGIRSAFSTGWGYVETIFNVWKAAWEVAGAGAMYLWRTVIEPVWEGIKAAFQSAWDFISPIFDRLKAGWDSLSGKVTDVAKAMGDGIRGAFDGVVDIIKAPLHALGDFLAGIPGEVLGVPIPGIDVVHGWGTSLQGLSEGGYTGNVGIKEAAGIVHGDEFVIRSRSRRQIENLYPGLLDFMNGNGKLPGYEEGGRVTVDQVKKFAQQLDGGNYVLGGPAGPTNTDCSGAQAWVSNFITGSTGRFATMTQDGELTKRGFKDGDPPPGIAAYWVGWKNGGPAGGHTAGTIVDPKNGNVNVEMGGAEGGGQYGGNAAGASKFPNRMWIALKDTSNPDGGELPVSLGGPYGGSGGRGRANADDIGAGRFSAPEVAPMSSSGGSSRGSLPSSLSGLAGFPFAGLSTKSGGGSTGMPEREFKFGDAIATGIEGQVSSALGVFGLPDAPPVLKAASQLLSGIKVGGKGLMDFSGAAAGPIAGMNPLGSTTPGGVSGNPQHITGGNPGPGNTGNGPTYHIQTARVEDAFVEAQQKEREAAAARLQRF